MVTRSKKVYMYDVDWNFIQEFKDTFECADYFNKEPEYINYNLCYFDKIRKDGKWYRISRKDLRK